jgi:hypothetical protein
MKKEEKEEEKEVEPVQLLDEEYCHYSGLPSPDYYQ